MPLANNPQNRDMTPGVEPSEPAVLVQSHPHLLTAVLNRPRVLNTLNLEMTRLLNEALERLRQEERLQFLLLRGAGEHFCAGGDLKMLARAVSSGSPSLALKFFQEEYALDLAIHQVPKPVVALAPGVTMGGGLGLAAGACLVLATETTRMAMPETRIGFFPDVGATGWLFLKCPPGYPEFLGLTGYEMAGPECVRLGLATHLTDSARLPEIIRALENFPESLPPGKEAGQQALRARLKPFFLPAPAPNPEMDAWVAEHFAGKGSLKEILGSLSQCRLDTPWCAGVYQRLSERSPTALALTLKLLRENEGRPLKEVFARETEAGRWMIRHPDYLEGIRARLLDKDDKPRWQPARIEEILEEEIGGRARDH